MSENWYVNCANCGKQVLVDGPEARCYFCQKSAYKKEDIMQENTVEERVVPPPPKKGKKRWAYYEQNKEAILADYYSLKLMEFFKRWRITSTTWLKLKKLWGVINKQKRIKPRAPVPDNQIELTEHERYLILLGYQQAVREFLKAT